MTGDSDLVRAFESSNSVKETISDALQGSTPTDSLPSKKIRRSQDYLGGDALRTLIGMHHKLFCFDCVYIFRLPGTWLIPYF